jgi:hypothetical protein
MASDYRAMSSATGFTATTNSTCNFNATTRQVTCTHRYSDSTGASSTATGVATYTSVANFVDEVSAIPPRDLATSYVATQTGAPGSSATNVFDGNGRITSRSNMSAAGVGTTTYTSWDSAGRPTGASDVGPGYSNTLVITMNDTLRTRTTSVNGGQVITVETFDANGNITSQSSSGGGATNSTAFTTNSTQRVCK